jgi:hypothetical protein
MSGSGRLDGYGKMKLMERFHIAFIRIWIGLAIAVDLIAIASLFMPEGSPWAVARRFTLIFSVATPGAYMWLRKRRKVVGLAS